MRISRGCIRHPYADCKLARGQREAAERESVRSWVPQLMDGGGCGILAPAPLLMSCPHCESPCTRSLSRTTDLNHTTDPGYAVFRCTDCGRKVNERTRTPF